MRWTVITNCDSFFITKCDTVYYNLRQVLQSAMDLLQISTAITKCDDYYKLRQYNAEDGLRKMTARTQKVKVKPMKLLTNVCTKKATSFYSQFALIVIYTVPKAKKKW